MGIEVSGGFKLEATCYALVSVFRWKTHYGRVRAEAVSEEAILVVWVKSTGYMDETGVGTGSDMWSNKGHVLKSEPMEIANRSQADVRDIAKTINSSGYTS